MRSAPAPDLLPIPGMNQGIAIAAGSGGSGGGDGSAGEGGDGEGAGGGSGGDDASGDNRNAPDKEKYPTCGTESHPVDVVTGQVFTHAITDLQLPGPLPLTFERSYSSTASKKDQGLGWGWAHSLGWLIEVERRRVRVWNEKGISVSFEVPEIGHSVLGDWGWVLRRELWGFAVDANDEVWRVFSVTFDEGKTFRLSAIDDRNKNRIGLTYDDGKLAEVKDSAGRIIKVTSTKDGHITSLQVKNAEHQGQWIRFARYEYDDKGRLVRVTDADDYVWTYTYDEFNRLVRDTDRAGLSFCFRYDEKDRGIEAWGEYIGKTDPSLADDVPKFLYDKHTRAKGIYHRKFDYYARGYTEVTDTTETRRYFGNAKGMLDKAVTGGAVTSSKYDERGFEIEKTDPIGATTRWVRDERGRVLEVVDALGRRTTIEWDAHGLPVQAIDPAGGVTRAQRDGRGNLETLHDAAGSMTQYAHDERGLLLSVTGPTGATIRYAYDVHGNLVEVVQPNGGRWTLTYDAFGRRLSARDPTGAETRHTYSDRGDLLAVYDAVGSVTRHSYDGERHLAQVVSPKGHVTQFSWGGLDKLCIRRNAKGHAVRMTYSREGELVELHNEREEVHRLRYNAAGKLIAEETFDRRTIQYRNDPAGRVVRVETGAKETLEFIFDAVGQLIVRKLADGSEETFDYNARGELVRATNADGEYRFERDALGRVVRETQKVTGNEHWVERAYDRSGKLVGRRTSLGHTEEVQRDVMGVPKRTLLDGEHRLEHQTDVLAREVQRNLPSGGVIESAFDPLGRLAQRLVRSHGGGRSIGSGEPEWIGNSNNGVASTTAYAYDTDGKLETRRDPRRGSVRYQYDPIGQLVDAVPEKARAEVFRYDPAGNVYEAVSDENERAYGEGNRLLRKGVTDYTWDEAGRLSARVEHTPNGDRVWSYFWNGAGLLERISTPDRRSVQFAYDPFARRVSKHVMQHDGLALRVLRRTRFVWDGDVVAHEIREDLGEGEPVVHEKSYLFLEGSLEPAAHRDTDALANDDRSGGWFHYVNDPIGTPEHIVDAEGRIACDIERRVWGETKTSTGSRTDTALRFQGQYSDDETGLTYNRARYYDPQSGRYISADLASPPPGCARRANAGNRLRGRGMLVGATAQRSGFLWCYEPDS
jgi:RHS repeat-associated protein